MAGRFLGKCELSEKEWLNASYYRLRFQAPEIAAACHAGQFVNIRLPDTLDPLLRRPMSIFRCDRAEGWIELLVKLVGKGTRRFSQARPGDSFDLLGPLGSGFRLRGVKSALLIGGGIGVAPLFFLAGELHAARVPVYFMQGFRSNEELCCTEDLRLLVQTLEIATDDGSAGFHGMVSELLVKRLREKRLPEGVTAFICGPPAMMAAVAKICNEHGIAGQVSVEAHMGCGFGACVGCAVPTADGRGYLLACKDGPVFELGEINLEA